MTSPNTLHSRERWVSPLRKTAVIASLTGVALGTTGCVEGVSPNTPCAAYSSQGDIIHPTAYPLGVADVQYQWTPGGIFQDGQALSFTQGIISDENGHYTLDVKSLPSKSHLGIGFDPNDYEATIQITTPKSGAIGFNAECVSEGVDNTTGLHTTLVELPTSTN